MEKIVVVVLIGLVVAQGALMRFLAEAAWYPTALLPSQGIAWEAIDVGLPSLQLTRPHR